MPCKAEKHTVTITMTCEMYELLCDAAHFTGCGDDLERYIKMLITERC